MIVSANVYRQHYADGWRQTVRRSIRQGRKPLPPEVKAVRVNITVSPVSKRMIQEKARKAGMSFSAYLELAGMLYTLELVNP